MLLIPRTYVVDDHNHRIAVQLDIATFERLEQVVEDHALGALIAATPADPADAERLALADARAAYARLTPNPAAE